MRWQITNAPPGSPLYDVAITSTRSGEPVVNGTVHVGLAPLIVNAPEMLECLRVLVDRFEYDDEALDEDQYHAVMMGRKLVRELVKEEERKEEC